jgi:hypothetical protein
MSNIEHSRETQKQIDNLYEEFRSIVYMENKIPVNDWTHYTRKKLRPHKPFWNEELTDLWKTMCEKEKKYLKYSNTDRQVKHTLKESYKYSQNVLDKRIRYYERHRQYKKGLALNLDFVSSHDPRQFWEKIKKLGPQRKGNIPDECYDENGEVTSNPTTLTNVWERDFSKLYNVQNETIFDESFKTASVNHKLHMEREMLEPLYESNMELNCQITIDEIKSVVMRTKSGKSCGLDDLPYEALKSDTVIQSLHKMFMLYFDTGLLPSIWRKAIICPILKDVASDQRLPMNYRGISLLSVVAKVSVPF